MDKSTAITIAIVLAIMNFSMVLIGLNIRELETNLEAVSQRQADGQVEFENETTSLQKRITDLESDVRVLKELTSGAATTSPNR